MEARNDKTIFFLGAGFSSAAGAPVQSELLGKVLNYIGDDYNNPVREYTNEIVAFFSDAFHLRVNQMSSFSLEDFYTPIDKCISENSSFRGYSIDQIKRIRNIVSTMISIVIDYELRISNRPTDYIDHLVEYIYQENSKRDGCKNVIISTNWDILVDRRIFERVSARTDIRTGLHSRIQYPRRINWGTEVILLEGRNDRIIQSENDMNLYKIHGSLNWLKCPSCNRLYVNPSSKIGILQHNLGIECRECVRNFRMPNNINGGFNLEPQIIYPTFLKNLSNIHFSKIWDSVSNVLTEAKKIIFIGYSFQQADYEIRQLLSRKVPDNCEIICVLNGARPSRDNNYWTTPQSRYENFFGGRTVNFNYDGARNYLLNNLAYDPATT